MITAFKPSKPDRPRTHCFKQDKRMKKRSLFVNDENSKRNICSYCLSKTYCHLGFKNEGRSTIGRARPQNNLSKIIKHQHRAHCNSRILHIACHLPHERHPSDVCHLKPWFQYQALCVGPALRQNVSLEKCTHENIGPYIKVNTYTRNKHNSHSQTTQRSVTWCGLCPVTTQMNIYNTMK